ncbi:hypothetical protein V2J09_011437 [Rumex salicifolius]
MTISRINCVTPSTTSKLRLGRGQLFLLLLLLSTTIHAAAGASGGGKTRRPRPPIAVRGCQDRCGNVSIPYPFGIGPDPKCFLNHWYRVNCTIDTGYIPKPFLASLVWKFSPFNDSNPLEIVSIKTDPITLPSSPNTPLLTLSVQDQQRGYAGIYDTREFYFKVGIDMRRSPFRIMPLLNTLFLVGCSATAALRNIHDEIVVGCTSVCPDANDGNLSSTLDRVLKDPDLVRNIKGGSCYGIRCCQASILKSLDYFQMEVRATLGSSVYFFLPILANTSHLADTTTANISQLLSVPAALQWKVVDLPHNHNSNTTICTYYNDTLDGGGGGGVIKGCEDCPDSCHLISHVNQTYGCPIIPVYPTHSKFTLPLSLGLGISLGSISMFVILYGLFRIVKVKKDIRVKHNNFKRNGGLLLQQQKSVNEGVLDRIKVFRCGELERATDNFNENRILGRGGQGTVYKGMLSDGTIVAIKKSKVDEGQSREFINEVVILSHIKHRNVVQLFGCCLETRVPLLVYEFVPNGTLYEHIHNPREEFRLTWNMRLQIAIESAEALRYLHSSSSQPIYHRDIKTCNILLDDRYRAKIADFGISRTVSIDQTHVTTNIQGTWGYIDPEYFQSNQFTEKSDVYSFGIVLLELLSSKKAVHIETSTESRALVSEFFLCMQQARLFDIVDANVLNEARVEEIEGFADLAKRCLSLKGSRRPTMKEVAMTLQMITSQVEVTHLSQKEHVFGNDEVCLIIRLKISQKKSLHVD